MNRKNSVTELVLGLPDLSAPVTIPKPDTCKEVETSRSYNADFTA